MVLVGSAGLYAPYDRRLERIEAGRRVERGDDERGVRGSGGKSCE